MKPVATDESNFTYKMPPGQEGGDLPCKREEGRVISWWECEEDDLAGLSPELPSVVLGIVNPAIVGCSIRIGGSGIEDLSPVTAQVDETAKGGGVYWQYTHVLSGLEVQLLRDGAKVRIMVDQTPPPPVYLVLS
jgi:hypothetical protein